MIYQVKGNSMLKNNVVKELNIVTNKVDEMPNDLSSYWMPFTTNRRFKKNPRFLVSAKDMYYKTNDNKSILDGVAGLWCVNAGHCRPRIVKAVQDQVAEMDYATAFNMGHPKAFTLASRLAGILPKDIDNIFYTNSGSEAVDTALKIALAYHNANGDAKRTRLIGRSRGYHGVGFGGMSVGGMVANRKQFSNHLPGVDHMQDTHIPELNAFSIGQPKHGMERDICTKNGILLIFDEVICGFGRLGTAFSGDKFNVIPDIMTLAKGITNATVPMGAVATHKKIYDGLMHGPEHVVELFHGYTYSGHSLACAAALATLEEYESEKLFDRANSLENYFGEQAHMLKDLDNVVDIRTIGLVAGIELKTREDGLGKRVYDVFENCFENNLLTRFTGETIAISPPLIVSKDQIKTIFSTIRSAILEVK